MPLAPVAMNRYSLLTQKGETKVPCCCDCMEILDVKLHGFAVLRCCKEINTWRVATMSQTQAHRTEVGHSQLLRHLTDYFKLVLSLIEVSRAASATLPAFRSGRTHLHSVLRFTLFPTPIWWLNHLRSQPMQTAIEGASSGLVPHHAEIPWSPRVGSIEMPGQAAFC